MVGRGVPGGTPLTLLRCFLVLKRYCSQVKLGISLKPQVFRIFLSGAVMGT